MRNSTTDRMNDYDVVVMGVLEPILVLSGDGGDYFSGAATLVRGWGVPSPEYYHRQADLCLRMALSSAQYEERLRLLDIANGYRASARSAEWRPASRAAQ